MVRPGEEAVGVIPPWLLGRSQEVMSSSYVGDLLPYLKQGFYSGWVPGSTLHPGVCVQDTVCQCDERQVKDSCDIREAPACHA